MSHGSLNKYDSLFCVRMLRLDNMRPACTLSSKTDFHSSILSCHLLWCNYWKIHTLRENSITKNKKTYICMIIWQMWNSWQVCRKKVNH